MHGLEVVEFHLHSEYLAIMIAGSDLTVITLFQLIAVKA